MSVIFTDNAIEQLGVSHSLSEDGLTIKIGRVTMDEIMKLSDVTEDNADDPGFDPPRRLFMATMSHIATVIGSERGVIDPEVMTCMSHVLAFLWPRLGAAPTRDKSSDDLRIDLLMGDVVEVIKTHADEVRRSLVKAGAFTEMNPEEKKKAAERAVAEMSGEGSILLVSTGPAMWAAMKDRVDESVTKPGVMFFATTEQTRNAVRSAPRNMVEILTVVVKSMGKHLGVKPLTMMNALAHVTTELSLELSAPGKEDTAIASFCAAMVKIGKVMRHAASPAQGHG